jgi:hypothetical protein
MARRFCVCVALCLTGAWLAAGTTAVAGEPGERTGSIVGQVTSLVTHQPISGAVIAVDGADASTVADEDGRFQIRALCDGTYRLLATHEGFLPKREGDVVVTAGRETPISVQLQDAPQRAENLEVSASYFSQPEDVSTGVVGLNYEEVRRAPGALGDVGRLIQGMPGAIGPDDSRNDIVARGGSPSENLILVDNLEVPNLSHFSAQGGTGGPITMLNSELISNVNFMAGGFPAPYGERLSSVLEVSLREGSRQKLHSELDLGMAGAGLLAEGPLGRRGSWIVSGRHSYLDLIAGAFSLTAIPRYSNYQTKLVYDLSRRNQLSFVSLGGYDTITFDADMTKTDNADTFRLEDVGWRAMTGLNLRTMLGDAGVGTFSLGHWESSYKMDAWDKLLGGQLIERNRSRERETTAKYDLTYELGNWANLRVGAYGKRLGAALDLAQPIGVENPFSTDGVRINALTINDSFVAWQGGGYAQLSPRLGQWATFTLGGRYDYFDLRRASRWSPRAGLTLHVTPQIDLSGSVGRYYQMPALLAMKATPANANLDPIRSDHYVAGLAFRPQPDLKITVEAYNKRYASYPVSTQVPSLSLADYGEQYDGALLLPLVSQGEGRASGVEFYVQKKLSGALWGQVSYAYSRTEQRALDRIWRPSTFDMPHVLSVIAGCKISKSLEVSSKFSYTSGRPDTPFLAEESAAQNRLVFDMTQLKAERTPAYHRLDFRLDRRNSFRWGSLVWYVEADNVYNRKNVRLYLWNAKTHAREPLNQLTLLVMGGVNVRF